MPTYPRPTGLGGASIPSPVPNNPSMSGNPRRPTVTPTRNDLTNEVINQPLPYDSTKIINEIRKQYQDQLAFNQAAFERQLAQQQQYNQSIDPNAGLAEHQRMLELLRQQQSMAQQSAPRNSLAFLYGY